MKENSEQNKPEMTAPELEFYNGLLELAKAYPHIIPTGTNLEELETSYDSFAFLYKLMEDARQKKAEPKKVVPPEPTEKVIHTETIKITDTHPSRKNSSIIIEMKQKGDDAPFFIISDKYKMADNNDYGTSIRINKEDIQKFYDALGRVLGKM